MAIETLSYKLVMDHKQFVQGAVASRKELNLSKRLMAETRTPAERLKTSIASLGGLYKKGAIDVTTYRRAVEQLKAKLTETKTAATGMSKALSAASKFAGAAGIGLGVVGVVGLARSAINSTRNFQSAISKSAAIMAGVNKDIREDMVETATVVAKATKFSAAEAAEAYFFLGSAGLTARQSIAALPQVSRFAQAGMFDMALATDLLTDAQSALGLSVKDSAKNLMNMTHVSDVLVKANTLANASVQQFSEALTNKAGAALKQLGIPLEEGVAVLAAFADQGVKGAEGGTALSIVLRDLTTKAIRNEGAMKRAGIAVFDQKNEFRKMPDIIRDVENALEGMSDKQRKATLLSVGFTDKSVGYISSLVGMSEKVANYNTALTTAGGTTDRISKEVLPPFEKAINLLSGQFDTFANETLAGVLTKLGMFVTDVGTSQTAVEGFLDSIPKMEFPLKEQIDKAFPDLGEYEKKGIRKRLTEGGRMTSKALVTGGAQTAPLPPRPPEFPVRQSILDLRARHAQRVQQPTPAGPFVLNQAAVDKAKSNVSRAAQKTLSVLETIERNTREAMNVEQVNL